MEAKVNKNNDPIGKDSKIAEKILNLNKNQKCIHREKTYNELEIEKHMIKLKIELELLSELNKKLKEEIINKFKENSKFSQTVLGHISEKLLCNSLISIYNSITTDVLKEFAKNVQDQTTQINQKEYYFNRRKANIIKDIGIMTLESINGDTEGDKRDSMDEKHSQISGIYQDIKLKENESSK